MYSSTSLLRCSHRLPNASCDAPGTPLYLTCAAEVNSALRQGLPAANACTALNAPGFALGAKSTPKLSLGGAEEHILLVQLHQLVEVLPTLHGGLPPSGPYPPGSRSDFICSGGVNPPGIKILPAAKCLDALTRGQRAGRQKFSPERSSGGEIALSYLYSSTSLLRCSQRSMAACSLRANRTSARSGNSRVRRL